jgi:hypothetical protein
VKRIPDAVLDPADTKKPRSSTGALSHGRTRRWSLVFVRLPVFVRLFDFDVVVEFETSDHLARDLSIDLVIELERNLVFVVV